MASAQAGMFPQQNCDLALRPRTAPHFSARIAAWNSAAFPLLEVPVACVDPKPWMAPSCPQDKICAPHGVSAMAPLPTLTSGASSGGIPSLP